MDYTESKKLFFEYGGSKFGMWHERVIEKYESFSVPRELEQQWQEEILDELRKRMKSNSTIEEKTTIIHSYIDRSREFGKKDALDFLKENKEKLQDLDDFSQLVIIEQIIGRLLPEEPERRKPVIEKCIEKLREMLEQEANGKFVIDESYYEQGQIPDYLTDGKLKERLDCILCEFLDKKNGV